MTRRLGSAILPLALFLLPPAAQAAAAEPEEPLGRLFHTPEQRRQLDRMRSLGASRPELEEKPALRLDGVLRHPDGRITAWINGQPVEGGKAAPGQGAEQARVVTGAGKSVSIRVGEALPADGSAPQDLLGDGRARRDAPRR